jgi:hypothetical protein
MTTTPNLKMPYLVAAQAQKEVTHNDALNDLDCLAQLSVIDGALSVPPVSPDIGDTYIIGESPSGAWSGFAGNVTAYYAGWKFKTPKIGWTAFSQSENRLVCCTGSGWLPLAAPFLDGAFDWNPGTITAESGVTSSAVTVTGAVLGDFASVAAPYDLQGVMATAYVTSANTVVVRLHNQTGADVTLASGAWRVRVVKH